MNTNKDIMKFVIDLSLEWFAKALDHIDKCEIPACEYCSHIDVFTNKIDYKKTKEWLKEWV